MKSGDQPVRGLGVVLHPSPDTSFPRSEWQRFFPFRAWLPLFSPQFEDLQVDRLENPAVPARALFCRRIFQRKGIGFSNSAGREGRCFPLLCFLTSIALRCRSPFLGDFFALICALAEARTTSPPFCPPLSPLHHIEFLPRRTLPLSDALTLASSSTPSPSALSPLQQDPFLHDYLTTEQPC